MTQTSRPTAAMIRELCTITTRDETGAHFTATHHHYEALEALGLVEIDRPVHEQTGLAYGEDEWSIEVTDAGQEVVDTHPDLHPA